MTSTVTTPTGAMLTTVRNADGSVAHVSGTGQRELHYHYDVNNNRLREMVKLADDTTILSQTLTNGFGETVVEGEASTSGALYTRSEYNAKGQLVKQYQDTGSNTARTAATLYEYDAFGNVTKQTLALSDTPTVENSPIVEYAYSVEAMDDGVFNITTRTRYNAEGNPLTSSQRQLISEMDEELAAKTIQVDEKNLTSVIWTEYTDTVKRVHKSQVPTSALTAETVSVDGFTISQTDHAGITATAGRSYTANGMTLIQTDGRGNATTTVTDVAGRTVILTDAAGNTTTTTYDVHHDQPAVITDAQGNTACYRYDIRGRKVAEWGTALQPATFAYDDANHLTALTTFRASEDTITTDPGNRTDGDATLWAYHDATGLETLKTYADGSSVSKTYDTYNRLYVETLARGITKPHRYEPARGLLLGTTYSDATAARSYEYNHLGQLTQVSDDAGVRTLGYNEYGEQTTDSLLANGVTHLITETRDAYGRSTGYTYAKNGTVQQTVATGYDANGRISSAGFLHSGAEKQFSYSYLPGSNLLQSLAMPNNMTLTQSYETRRDLLTGMAYHRGSTLVTQRSYSYDALGRPTARTTTRQGTTKNDTFSYNNRSELTGATVSGESYGYDYDNIGNRRMAIEGERYSLYRSNQLNQYTGITQGQGEEEANTFAPEFDADGNQTLVKTATGIWSVQYNAENRPILFTREEENGTETQIACTYDSMGRRATKKVTTGGSVTLHQRYLYRVYLQIASCDLSTEGTPNLWHILWDPTQSVATRPLAIQKDGARYTYGWDLTKNVCELFDSKGAIATAYNYTPYGEVTADGNITQPIQWFSEYHNLGLGLVYYNYRHYNPTDGRLLSRDMIGEQSNMNLWNYVGNRPTDSHDILGLDVAIRNTRAASGFHWKICVTEWKKNPSKKQSECCYQRKWYVRTGTEYCIGFGPHEMHQMWPSSRAENDTRSRHPGYGPQPNNTPMPPEMRNVNQPGANGVVSRNNEPEDEPTGLQPEHLPDIKTTCIEDILIKEYLKGQVGQTADYCIAGGKNNCRWYAYYVYKYIIEKILNPRR